ncbi:protein of unknown function [Chryseobacterium sp. JV274]|nr:protein of unknown function [Chryseobacterium sp. JV274]
MTGWFPGLLVKVNIRRLEKLKILTLTAQKRRYNPKRIMELYSIKITIILN